jgi:hypothetical protein
VDTATDANGLTRAEVVAMAAAACPAAAVVAAWLLDAAGLPLGPGLVLVPAAVVAGALVAGLFSGARRDGRVLALGIVVVAGAGVWLAWLARPDLLPLGSGPDLVHHLGLIRYIETHQRLVHDPGVEQWLGEMVSYTPGSHVLVVLSAQVLGTDGLRTFHAVCAAAVALKAGLVVLLAVRLAPATQRVPAGLLAAGLMFLPRAYVIGSFTHDAYLAQVVAETFTVAAWLALTVWDERPRRWLVAVCALFTTATFLTWPIWVGPLLVGAAVLIGRREGLSFSVRAGWLAAVALPVGVTAGAYLVGRLAWTGIVKTSGAVQPPSIAGFGVVLPLLAAAGIWLCRRARPARTAQVLLASIAAQAAVLYAVARAYGADTPYMAYKMAYLAVYPLAVFGAAGVAAVAARAGAAPRPAGLTPWLRAATAWMAAAVLLGAIRAEARHAPQPPVVSRNMQRAAQWLADRGETACADYVTSHWVSAYWLHVVELGNPRLSARTAAITDTFDARAVVGRWVDPRGPFRFAIVEDLEGVHPDARASMETVARFGRSGVVRRRVPGSCP